MEVAAGPASPFAVRCRPPRRLPEAPGVYMVRSEAEALYTGWATNLREQASRLTEAGAGDIIPDWMLYRHGPPRTVADEAGTAGTVETRLHDPWLLTSERGRC